MPSGEELSYDERRAEQQLALFRYLGPALERIEWEAERLRQLRTQALRELVRHALKASPWHAKRLSGLDPENVSEDTLGSLPTMTKADLMAHWDEIVTNPRLTLRRCEDHIDTLAEPGYLENQYHAITSGGSSGNRGVFVYGWDEWVVFYGSYARWLPRGMVARGTPLQAGDPMASVGASALTHGTSGSVRTFVSAEAKTASFPTTLPLSEIVSGLNQTRPRVLFGYASMLGVLAAETMAGRLQIRPEWVWSTAEPLLPEIAEAIERAWGTVPVNGYGSSDVGSLGSGCGLAAGIHLNDDTLIIEPVDSDGNPVAAGQTSAKILATPFTQFTLPLLRYEMSDEVTPLDEPCPCGSHFSRIEDISGRLDDIFIYTGGLSVHPHILRSVLGRERNVPEYQVQQQPRGLHVRVRLRAAIDENALARAISAALEGVGMHAPEVRVSSVETIERVGIGKLKRFVPL